MLRMWCFIGRIEGQDICLSGGGGRARRALSPQSLLVTLSFEVDHYLYRGRVFGFQGDARSMVTVIVRGIVGLEGQTDRQAIG